ncbi:BLUF domain-containing protein [Rubrolithibacter danxiaensis]|uniref:BLUF domain-containing protein n=1 Tax=Rubrolithibacter danxiaensis TaxID=3390805 RepID=UPI003BF84B1B
MEKGQWCIVYVSSATKELTSDYLAEVIETTRHYRRAHNNSGLTILSHQNLLVTIEGTQESVLAEYQLAKMHPFHHSVIKLYEGPVPHRFFEDYILAFKIIAPENFKDLDNFKTPGKKEYLEEFLNLANPVSTIVANFIRNNT